MLNMTTSHRRLFISVSLQLVAPWLKATYEIHFTPATSRGLTRVCVTQCESSLHHPHNGPHSAFPHVFSLPREVCVLTKLSQHMGSLPVPVFGTTVSLSLTCFTARLKLHRASTNCLHSPKGIFGWHPQSPCSHREHLLAHIVDN